MFGKGSLKYKNWANHARELRNMPKDCKVINTGSTPSFKAFDYRLWSVQGYNLGFQPQPLYYDFETLKKYSQKISKGAKICIGIEEFKFLVDAYDDKSTDYKYYLWLDKDQIRTYDEKTGWLMKHAPAVLHPEFALGDIKWIINRVLRKKTIDFTSINTETDDMRWADRWVSGWNKEFGWEIEQKITSDQAKIIHINEKRLSDMIDYCIGKGWNPCLVIPPFSPNLSRLLSGNVLRKGLWEPIARVSEEKNIPVFNYYFDKRFANYNLYTDALTFNETGKRFFNKVVQEQIGVTEGVAEMQEKTYELRNGVSIPWISYGTGVVWKYTRNIKLFLKVNIRQALGSLKHMKMSRELYGNLHMRRILTDAYESGFRMFDSGRIYAHSEDRIGDAVSGMQGVFITTKCSWMDITRTCSPSNVAGNLAVSLKNLKRDSVDLYLLHWPEGEWIDIYSQIIREYEKGNCRAFGACNMSIENLEAIKQAGLALPMVVQTEMHPLCVKKELRDYCKRHKIQLMAHTPTAHSIKELKESNIMKILQEKYNKNVVQITMRWHYQNNVIPVVSTFSKEHMRENLDIFDFELTDEEMKAVDSLNKNKILLDSHGIDDPNYVYNY